MNSSTLASKKAEIMAAHQSASWSELARQYPGVKRGTLQRFATTDYEPRRASVRAALGLPVLALAPVCACGQVHTSESCPNRPKPPRKPRTDWKGRALRAEAHLRRVTGI